MDTWENCLEKHENVVDLMISSSADSLTTFRLEHRESGELARHEGEERILILRSDRPGPVGKIVFSSELQKSENSHELTARVFTHVLDVKEAFRGFDLGGLLVAEQLSFLKARYLHHSSAEGCTTLSCQLEAEEDVRRHNKLTSFYERHGYERTIGRKVQYLNNNDGETYRKVPMHLLISRHDMPVTKSGGMMKDGKEFIAVHASRQSSLDRHFANGEDNSPHSINLVLAKGPDGWTELYTTTGSPISFISQGKETLSSFDQLPSLGASKFCFLSLTKDFASGSYPKEHFLIQSSGGSFLVLNPNHELCCSEEPAFWRFESKDKRLVFTNSTPQQLIHSTRHFQTQTMEYVNRQREKYLSFQLARLSLDEALSIAKSISFEKEPSLFHKCIQTAERFRDDGQPDWVQLVGLLYYLGGIIPSIEKETTDISEQNYDWTMPSASWIIGCSFPHGHNDAEFLHLNPDYRDHEYIHGNIYSTKCGLDNALMTWSVPEYMYNFLKTNCVNIPSEGAKMLRLAKLDSWLYDGAYSQIQNDDDKDLRFIVSDFVDVLNSSSASNSLSESDCQALWEGHYMRIAEKYGAANTLLW